MTKRVGSQHLYSLILINQSGSKENAWGREARREEKDREHDLDGFHPARKSLEGVIVSVKCIEKSKT